jgi:abhydrolase domain-containing protein 6
MFVNAPNPNGPGMSATQAPTLIMWGKEDRLVHYTGAYTYQAIIPHADVLLFDGVGHLPMVEIPIRTAKALQEFWMA